MRKIIDRIFGRRLPQMGKDCKIGTDVIFTGAISSIKLGDKVRIKDGARIDCHQQGKITIGNDSVIGYNTYICTGKNGEIIIGDNCSLNIFSVLYGFGGLHIGNNVRIATHTVIIPANHIFADPEAIIKSQGLEMKGVKIADDVWIGSNVTILDGVNIGKGSVIGAGSVVTKNVEPYSVMAGVPAKKIKSRGERA